MRRNLFAWIPVAGILIQMVFCMPAMAANLKTTTTKKYRITGVVKDALGRPIKHAALSLQDSSGKIVAHATSNDAGEFSFNAIPPGTYAVVATSSGFKPATSIVSVSAKGAAPVAIAMEAEKEVSLRVAAKRLNQARNSLSPNTGGSKYTFTQQAIQELPQGDNTPLNQVLLQAPGVAQDSFGQIHVRGDHANLQYRINGVQLPEGITGFGQVLSPRFAQSISLLTGALPAEYGLRTAGVIDIKTKDGLLDPVADVDFYGGQRGTTQPSFEYGGSKGNFSYYMTGQYLGTDRGVEPPTPGPTAIHDTSNQGIVVRILLVLSESDDAAEPDLGSRGQSLSDSRQPESAAGVRAGRSAGLSVGESPREPDRAELLQRAGAAGSCWREYRLPDRAVQPLLDGYFQSRPRRRPDL